MNKKDIGWRERLNNCGFMEQEDYLDLIEKEIEKARLEGAIKVLKELNIVKHSYFIDERIESKLEEKLKQLKND